MWLVGLCYHTTQLTLLFSFSVMSERLAERITAIDETDDLMNRHGMILHNCVQTESVCLIENGERERA